MWYIVEEIKDKEVNKAILYGARSMKELKENLIIYEEQKSRIAESSVRQVRPEDNRKYSQSASVVKYRDVIIAAIKNMQVLIVQTNREVLDVLNVENSDTFQQTEHLNLRTEFIKFDSIGAVNVHTMGRFKTEIMIDGLKATLDFDVVRDNYLGHDVLLGIELTEQMEIRVKNKQVKFIQIKKEQRVNQCAVEDSEWNKVLNIDVCSEQDDRDKVELDHIVDRKIRDDIKNLISEYTVTKTKDIGVRMKIILEDDAPVYQNRRRLSAERRKQEIEILRKERDLERERITKAANQEDQAEQSLISIVKEYEQYREKMQKTVTDAEVAFSKLLEEKNALALQLEEEKRKCEDLQFRFEEESVNKDDIQKERREQFVINTVNENKIKDIEKLEERERVGRLERVSIKSFETEEEMTRLRNEVSNATAQETQQIEDLQSRNKNWEGSRNNLASEVQEKRIIMEQCINKKTELQSKLKENRQESAVHKKSEKSLRTEIERATKDLEKKNTLIEDMKKQFEHSTNTLKEQLQKAAETIENIKRKIEQFNYKVEHRPGTKMRHVDALSRNIVGEVLVQEDRSGLGNRVCKAQEVGDEFEDNEGVVIH
uniref:kinesin-like protein KIF20B n=1 Tax=Bombus vancouverensis nearcticus TaxID=2705178 RepID=UPI001438D749|nr:kinesin-like protein KIF20B [Bombus vancouverensis nearcticus]